MKRKIALLTLLVLPLAWALFQAISFRLHNRSNGSIVTSGDTRKYLLFVPRSYDPSRPTPLVISLHGAGGWPVQQMEMSGWNRVAEREGFLVVYPSGVERDGPRFWGAGRGSGRAKDVRFISDLIDKLQASYNIDPKRIYANGLSNGGGMTFVLSCSLSHRIAAVGMVASAQTLSWSWCTDQRAVPMINFHGTADPVTPYKGGTTWVSARSFPAIPAWTENWARRNRCEPKPVQSTVAADVTRLSYTHCADDASVVLYRIEGGGHTWPGGQPLPEWFVGPTTRTIDASSEMWAFFREHPLAPR